LRTSANKALVGASILKMQPLSVGRVYPPDVNDYVWTERGYVSFIAWACTYANADDVAWALAAPELELRVYFLYYAFRQLNRSGARHCAIRKCMKLLMQWCDRSELLWDVIRYNSPVTPWIARLLLHWSTSSMRKRGLRFWDPHISADLYAVRRMKRLMVVTHASMVRAGHARDEARSVVDQIWRHVIHT